MILASSGESFLSLIKKKITWWKVIVHFWDKYYQERIFKSHSNAVIFCKLG